MGPLPPENKKFLYGHPLITGEVIGSQGRSVRSSVHAQIQKVLPERVQL